MIIRNINLETVCGITSKLPENTLPEIAFAGKSNVGKSSLGVLPGTVVIPFSSVTKQGRDEIWELVESQFLNV